MKNFEFNENGKCLNPDVIMEIKNKVYVYPILLLEVFEHEGIWYNGLKIAIEEFGSSHGTYIVNHPNFRHATREEAINDAISRIKFKLKNYNTAKAQQIRNCVANYEKANNRVQLTLNLF